MQRDFADLLGADHGGFAAEMLKDRRDTIKNEVQEKLAAARTFYEQMAPQLKAERSERIGMVVDAWIKASKLRRACVCPACGMKAGISGETVGRSPVRIDEISGTIRREIRVLPNLLKCPSCRLDLNGYQEMNEAGLGAIYTIEEEEDPVEYFGIIPEEYVDLEELVRQRLEDAYDGYDNE